VSGALAARSIPTFVQVRSASATLKVAQLQASKGPNEIASLEGQLRAAEGARIAAEAQAREALDLAVQEEGIRKLVEDERNQERARAMVLAARVRGLESRVDVVIDQTISRPEQYAEVASWVESQFAGRMKLHARALRGLKNAVFNDLNLVCGLLELLAIDYVDSKRGKQGAWKRFEEHLKDRGVECTRSISETRAGEQGDEYYVRYRNGRVFLEWHLKKGTSRDAGRDLRIYFFWDDEDEEVVIGFLPGHLDNRIT
jgi:hypothetical protein